MKLNQNKIFWASILIFVLSLFYSLPRLSAIKKMREEKVIIDSLQGSDPYHVQWHEDQAKAAQNKIKGAWIVFLIGLGSLSFGLYFKDRVK